MMHLYGLNLLKCNATAPLPYVCLNLVPVISCNLYWLGASTLFHRSMIFGQLVIGPPGSGKTTYCNGMSQFLEAMGRKVAVINIDPANDTLPYKCSADISELITVNDVMDSFKLGPNGGLIYCMEYLEKNVDWLMEKIEKLKDHYLIIDCPGQVELYTHNQALRNIMSKFTKKDYRLVAVHLVDSHYCSDPGKFIAVLLTSLCTMIQMELPHVNVLSKADLIEKFGKLKFSLDFYTEVMDLSYLLDHLIDDPFMAKYNKMNERLTGLIEDYSLVSFVPLSIQEKKSMLQVMKQVDKANGYVFGKNEERNIQSLLSCAMGSEFEYTRTSEIQEKYINTDKR